MIESKCVHILPQHVFSLVLLDIAYLDFRNEFQTRNNEIKMPRLLKNPKLLHFLTNQNERSVVNLKND